MSDRWCLPVSLESDELLSSWLARAALTQGCDPLVLTGSVWPNWRAWARDVDRGVSNERIVRMAMRSGVEADALHASSLYSTVETITTNPLDKLAIWPWILTQGHRNRKRLGGLQYCSACLAHDQSPYYRQQWRLAWHIGCPTHSTKLRDRCWDCYAPVQPHRLLAEDKHLAICSTCKQDLRKASLVNCPESSLVFQNTADAVIQTKNGGFGGKSITSQHWFTLSRFFLAVLRRAAIRPTDNLASMIKTLGIDPHSLLLPATGLQLEMLPIEERETLLAGIYPLLKIKPEDFLEAAAYYSVTRATLYGASQCVPEALNTIISSLPEGVASQRNKTDTISNGYEPRSKQSVKRMYARLQRKLPMSSP